MQGSLRYRLYPPADHRALGFQSSVRVTSTMRYDTTNNCVLEHCGSGILCSYPKQYFKTTYEIRLYVTSIRNELVSMLTHTSDLVHVYSDVALTSSRAGKEISSSLSHSNSIESMENLPTECV